MSLPTGKDADESLSVRSNNNIGNPHEENADESFGIFQYMCHPECITMDW